jgi:hypothetical protein
MAGNSHVRHGVPASSGPLTGAQVGKQSAGSFAWSPQKSLRPLTLRHVGSLTALLLVLTMVLGGCGYVLARARSSAVIHVSPAISLFDMPVSFRMSQLPAHHVVTVDCSSEDGKGLSWTSSERFPTTDRGPLDKATASSLGGSYRGAEAMGIVSAMTPASGRATDYYWSSGGNQFRVAVYVSGVRVATSSFRRRPWASGVTNTTQTLAKEGFVGPLWLPPSATRGARRSLSSEGRKEVWTDSRSGRPSPPLGTRRSTSPISESLDYLRHFRIFRSNTSQPPYAGSALNQK